MASLRYPLPVKGAQVSINVTFNDTHLTLAEYQQDDDSPLTSAAGTKTSAERALSKRIREELDAYWRNAKHRFNLPLLPAGTRFQQKVWQRMCAIPAGQTQTYGEVAKILQSAPRAVGGACGANPFPLFVPCHRIVGQRHLGGFSHQRSGVMLVLKETLLAHEGALPTY